MFSTFMYPGRSAPPRITTGGGGGGGGTLLFNGDYSTGNFSQWGAVHNKDCNHTGLHYDAQGWTYPARIVTDPTLGIPVARYEVRSGDPGILGVGGSPRSEVADFDTGQMTEGNITWQKCATKFDSTWPTTASPSLWAVTHQWHAQTDGSPPVGFSCVTNGKWQLGVIRYSAPNVEIDRNKLWETDMLPGTWHEIKMRIRWSASDTVGFIELWHQGVRQTFLNSSTTYSIRTMMPGDPGDYYKEGLYRGDRAETGIVYHHGYKMATSEAALG